MRSVILGITILMAVPAYAVGQQRDRSERVATGRTAVPREETGQAATARAGAGRPEPRRAKATTAAREDDKAGDTSRSHATQERRRRTPDADRTGRGRDVHRQGNPWLVLLPGHHNVGPFSDRGHGRLGPRDRDDQRWYGRSYGNTNVVFVPYAVPFVEREVVIERDEVAETPVPLVEEPLPGRLVLEVEPSMAQIFADGYYVGTPDDFRLERGGGMLEPGPHRIEILARDHEPVSFDVNLARGQSVTFRRVLTPVVSAPTLAPDVRSSEKKQPVTFYHIPGCYMGNVPPEEANLPATCDLTRAVSVQY